MRKRRFTKGQISDWHAYEQVRAGGRYNMFFPQAKDATGLGDEEYSFCMKFYSELKEQSERSYK